MPRLSPIPLSSYGSRSVKPSPVNRMMSSFAATFREGTDINLGVGYVNQETMPRHEIAAALEHVLANPAVYRNALNYGGAQGSPNLIAAIRRFCVERGWVDEPTLSRCEMLIGASGATSILEGIALVVKPGIVITSDPMYYIYCDFLERAGFEVIAVPEDGEGIRLDLLEQRLKALGSRKRSIRFVYVSTVGNPTSVLLSGRRRQGLVELVHRLSAQLRTRVPLVIDTAYEGLIHDPSLCSPGSALRYDEAGLVYEVGSFSKVLAPALRVGYLLGRRDAFFDALVQNVSDTGFSAPLVIQEMASFILQRDAAKQLAAVCAEYRSRSQAIGGWIRQHLGPHLESQTGGQAGFYYYLTMKHVRTDERSDFFRRLSGPDAKPLVVYIPGQFCVHPKGELRAVGKRQLRISYGYESMANIERGLELMGAAVGAVRSAGGGRSTAVR